MPGEMIEKLSVVKNTWSLQKMQIWFTAFTSSLQPYVTPVQEDQMSMKAQDLDTHMCTAHTNTHKTFTHKGEKVSVCYTIHN